MAGAGEVWAGKGRELRGGVEPRAGSVGQEQGAFGADHERGLLGVLGEAEVAGDRLRLRRREELAVEPLHGEVRPLGGGVAGELPREVVALRPGVPAAGRRGAPGGLHFGGDGAGGGEAQTLPDGVKDVAADVAGPAGAEILPRAPGGAVVDFRRVGPGGRVAEPEVPSERIRRRGGLDGARPLEAVAGGSRAVGAKVGAARLPDRPRAEEMDREPVARARRVLRAQLRRHARGGRGEGERAALGHVVRHRLLAIDGDPAADRGERDHGVHMVRDRDVAGLEGVALLREQLAPVGVGARVRELALRGGEQGRVGVAERGDAQARVGAELVEVGAAHPAGADRGVAQNAIPRHGASPGGGAAGGEPEGAERGEAEEFLAGEGRGGRGHRGVPDVLPAARTGRAKNRHASPGGGGW